ncbi:589_t:CDS:2, partial [Diversispora eburnea]
FDATLTEFLGRSDYVLCTNDSTIPKMPVTVFWEMACNGLHYGILSNYSDTYFLKREETSPTTLYSTRVIQPNDTIRLYANAFTISANLLLMILPVKSCLV